MVVGSWYVVRKFVPPWSTSLIRRVPPWSASEIRRVSPRFASYSRRVPPVAFVVLELAPPCVFILFTVGVALEPRYNHRVIARNLNTNNIHAANVLLGDMGTGKTSLVMRFVKGQFFSNQEPTIGAAFFTQILSLTEATVKFDIWDTAGQERYHSLAPMYYRGAAAAVVVYDISSSDTFVRAKKWVQELQRQGNLNLVMALVANKSDLEPKREVETEEGEQFAQENGMLYIETSAKTAENINELFYEIAKRLAKAFPSKPNIGVNLNNEVQEKRRMFCCLG